MGYPRSGDIREKLIRAHLASLARMVRYDTTRLAILHLKVDIARLHGLICVPSTLRFVSPGKTPTHLEYLFHCAAYEPR